MRYIQHIKLFLVGELKTLESPMCMSVRIDIKINITNIYLQSAIWGSHGAETVDVVLSYNATGTCG
jgi:hypothetical protein